MVVFFDRLEKAAFVRQRSIVRGIGDADHVGRRTAILPAKTASESPGEHILVGAHPDVWMRQDRFDFRGNEKRVGASPVIQSSNADGVARQQQSAAVGIEKREREIAQEAVRQVIAVY